MRLLLSEAPNNLELFSRANFEILHRFFLYELHKWDLSLAILKNSAKMTLKYS